MYPERRARPLKKIIFFAAFSRKLKKSANFTFFDVLIKTEDSEGARNSKLLILLYINIYS